MSSTTSANGYFNLIWLSFILSVNNTFFITLSSEPADGKILISLKHRGTIKIDDLVKKACISNRQFERTFKDRMGVSPKFYSRLVRFGKAWLLKENNPYMTWTQVAYECNYFDQMHLVRDFKVFADTNPKEISNAFEKQPFLVVKGIFY